MRNKFDEQLDKLNGELIAMGALCERAIATAIGALQDGNITLARDVFEIDSQIDRKESDIETLCMKLLLHQQPVAKDLRLISAALKMISDMERIGDQAADIAEITFFIGNSDIKNKIHLRDMANAAVKMVTDSVDSFVRRDLSLAESVIAADDVVDGFFDAIKKELIEIISTDNTKGEVCVDLLMIVKYLERIADHATNIAEWVEFSITGTHRNTEMS